MEAMLSVKTGQRRTDKAGWVYAVSNPAWPGYVKIGSALDIDKRLTSYQTGCPHRAYRLEASAYVADRVSTERELMEMFKADRHQHEWFRLDVAVVARVLGSIHTHKRGRHGGR